MAINRHDGEIVDTYTLYGKVVTRGEKVRSDILPKGEKKLGAVLILFSTDGEVLLQKRAGARSYSGKWDFTAGGGAQSGESSKEAAVREFKEETGLSIELSLNEPLTVGQTNDWYIVYYAQVVNSKDFASHGRPHSDEVSEFKWFTLSEFEELYNTGEFRGDICQSVRAAVYNICEDLWVKSKKNK